MLRSMLATLNTVSMCDRISTAQKVPLFTSNLPLQWQNPLSLESVDNGVEGLLPDEASSNKLKEHIAPNYVHVKGNEDQGYHWLGLALTKGQAITVYKYRVISIHRWYSLVGPQRWDRPTSVVNFNPPTLELKIGICCLPCRKLSP